MLIRPEQSERDNAVSVLRAFIESGGYVPGDRLPSERELIGSLSMTRNRLRKALDALERDGEIWRHVGKGTFVSAQGSAAGAGSLVQLSQQITPVQLMRARIALEPALAREAALHASHEAVVRLRQAMRRCRNAGTWDAYEAQDDSFHRSIAEATDNVLLLSLFDQLNQVRRTVAWNNVVRQTNRPDDNHTSFEEHEKILEGIEARDPVAAQAAMHLHLRSVSGRLFGEL